LSTPTQPLVSGRSAQSTRQARFIVLMAALITAAGCGGSGSAGGVPVAGPPPPPVSSPVPPVQGTRTITYGGVSVQVVIDMPPAAVRDALVLYHPTVWFDDRILPAAENTLQSFKRLLYRDDTLLVSVAYPQQNREIGDGLREAEAALLWVKNEASRALGLSIGRVFIAGHSQGAYVVTRLNTLHQTDGVIANAPGPLDFEFRCLLEERGGAPGSQECGLMVQRYGPASANPVPYRRISLLSFTEGFKADVLFVQGRDDSAIQMRSWPLFKQAVEACTNCQRPAFLDVAGGHDALFMSFEAREAFNQFIDRRRAAATAVGND
jgi:hypothetical protein